MKFLIIGDLHGNKPLIHYKDFDAIIAPGDFCSDAPRQYMFQALRERMNDPKSKREWYDIVGKARAQKMVQKSLHDGRTILSSLNAVGVPVYIVPGNWDWTKGKDKWAFLNDKDYYSSLIDGLGNVVDTHHSLVDAGPYQFIGHGIISGPEYPQHKENIPKSAKKRHTLKSKYNKLEQKVSHLFDQATKPVIFLPHNVPFNTRLDMITNKESPRYGYHYGSVLARDMIKKHHPLVCISGHMHEHFGKQLVGKTTVINAGFGSKVNTLLELERGKVKSVQFYPKPYG